MSIIEETVSSSRNKDPPEAKRARTDDDWSRLFHLLDTLDLEALQRNAPDSATLDKCHANLSNLLGVVTKIKSEKVQQERTVSAERSINNQILPIEAFRAVARSGFVATNDLGRLLLLSCKAFCGSIGREYIFQALLKASKGASLLTTHIGSPFLGHHEAFFRALLRPPLYKGMPVIREATPGEPTLNAENLVYIISSWRKGTQTAAEIIPSSSFDQVWSGVSIFGHVDWKPSKEGEFSLVQNSVLAEERKMLENANLTDGSNLSAKVLRPVFGEDLRLLVVKVHCIRRDTNQVCTLYHSRHDKYNCPGSWSFHRQPALRLTEKGTGLLARYCNTTSNLVQERGGLSIELRSGVLRAVMLGAKGIPITPTFKTRYGVSVYHVLEELAGWSEAAAPVHSLAD